MFCSARMSTAELTSDSPSSLLPTVFSVNLIPWASEFKKIRFVNVQNLRESKVNKLPVENNVFFFLWNYYTYDQLLCTKNIFHPTLFYIYTYQ